MTWGFRAEKVGAMAREGIRSRTQKHKHHAGLVWESWSLSFFPSPDTTQPGDNRTGILVLCCYLQPA